MKALTAIAACCISLLASCRSFAVVPMAVEARCGDRVVSVRVWISDQGLMDGYSTGAQALYAVLLYPLNVVGGVVRGVSAPFDRDYDIECGPVGFLVGVAIPGFTLMPRMMRNDPWRMTVTSEEIAVFTEAGAFNASAVMGILRRCAFVGLEKVLYVEIGGERHEITPFE